MGDGTPGAACGVGAVCAGLADGWWLSSAKDGMLRPSARATTANFNGVAISNLLDLCDVN
jgi:hypothetical protein